MLYVCNVDEEGLVEGSAQVEAVRGRAAEEGAGVVVISGQVESELAELDDEEKAEFLADLGLEEPGLARLARGTYTLLGLRTYFTAGPKEPPRPRASSTPTSSGASSARRSTPSPTWRSWAARPPSTPPESYGSRARATWSPMAT